MHWSRVPYDLVHAWAALPAVVLGAWVRLLVLASETENCGRLLGARDWTARDWLVRAAVDADELAAVVAAGAASWTGRDLTVAGYDPRSETLVQAQRDRALRLNEKRSAQGEPAAQPESRPTRPTVVRGGRP